MLYKKVIFELITYDDNGTEHLDGAFTFSNLTDEDIDLITVKARKIGYDDDINYSMATNNGILHVRLENGDWY